MRVMPQSHENLASGCVTARTDGSANRACDTQATSPKSQNPVLSGGGEQRFSGLKRRSLLRRQSRDQGFVMANQSQMRERLGAQELDSLQACKRRPFPSLALKKHIFRPNA